MGNGRGQVAVEAALALPLVAMLGLGVVQLGLVQQARLLEAYAAFAAARVGAVWGASNARMHDAALLVLLPLLGRADSWGAVAASWPEARARDLAMHARLRDARPKGLPALMEAGGLAGVVRVDVLRPVRSQVVGESLDFDLPDPSPEGLEATRLTVRVRYLHELVVPLANWAIFTCWLASHPEGPEDAAELEVLAQVAREDRRYFLPLFATYTVRMQSSVRREWLP
ncbi:MAG TPA: TadE family protein [Myxococcaceae bacterium]|nr:TadE family protein [Myxococcaceae bacterium]